MENIRRDDLTRTAGSVSLPSGYEVESARLHMPTDGGQHTSGLTQPGWKEKLDMVRSRSMDQLQSVRNAVSTRVSSIRPATRRSVARAQTHLRTHPTQWAGAAVAAGFAVGLAGRLLMHRAQRRSVHDVIVIGAC